LDKSNLYFKPNSNQSLRSSWVSSTFDLRRLVFVSTRINSVRHLTQVDSTWHLAWVDSSWHLA